MKEARPARERVKVREALQGQGTGKENPHPQGPGQNFSPVPLQAAFDRPHSDSAAAQAHPKAAEAPKQDMGTGPDSQQNQADGGNRGVSVTRMRIPRNRKQRPGSPHNPHLVPPETSGRMCQASRGGARKGLDPAHSAFPGAPPRPAPPRREPGRASC